MRTNLPDRSTTFFHEDGCLVRTVTGADGRRYTHRCSLAVFETVSHAVEESAASGTTLLELVRRENLPHTQVDITLAFLHERGITDRRHRRSYPATGSVHLDAMIEWHALHEAPV